MNSVHLNSVIFHTPNLKQVSAFYSEIVGLVVGTYSKDGRLVPDESENYVNFQLGHSLLCFEKEGERIDLGTLVLNVEDLKQIKQALSQAGVKILKESPHFFIASDPDGRELIFEPTSRN